MIWYHDDDDVVDRLNLNNMTIYLNIHIFLESISHMISGTAAYT